MSEVITHVFTVYQPDLSFAWLGVTDECGHQFLMADERQLDYSDETAQAYAEYVDNAYALVDECLGDLLNILLLGRDTIFVLSDHGIAPIHSQVYVNTILEQAGLLRYGDGSNLPVDTANSKAVAVASGGAVNVYINLDGREQPGVVSPEDYASVQDEIVDALQSAVNADGETLFARVLRREELLALHLDSPNSGDVFAQAALGYALTDRRGNPDVVGPAPYYGQHGYDSTWSEMHAILVAAGYGIRPGVRLPGVHLLDVLPTVASLLRVKPVEAVDGRVLVEMLQERP
jgi:predicted AlkP superfamily phosphohydrolase/phosphomutase